MKHFTCISIMLLLTSCTRDWKNPIESDEELKSPPAIEQITLDAQSNFVLYLSSGYSEKSNILLERKTKGGFERISYVRLSQAALVDTSFDKEFDNNFVYRVLVEKNGYRTEYSVEKPFAYVSNILNAPQGLLVTILELQGGKLEWIDQSSKETGFRIEKNTGSGFAEIANLPANSQSYLDRIDRIPSLPLQLSYRVRAYSSTLISQPATVSTEYSGIGAPTDLRTTDTTAWHFTIKWQDNSNIETGYSVERNKNGGSFGEIAQLNANATQYTDSLTGTGSYGYRVRAKKDNIFSLHSNEVYHTVTTVAPLLTQLIVSAKANIFGAGKTIPPDPSGGGGGVLPVEFRFTVASGQYITFPSVSGSITQGRWGYNGPDGSTSVGTDMSSFGGISGITYDTRNMFLIGVFLNDNEPQDPAPPRLSFSEAGFVEISPALNQTFFVGDGLSGTENGQIQKFIVPDNASRLYLGFADGWYFTGSPGYYDDNAGELTVKVLLSR